MLSGKMCTEIWCTKYSELVRVSCQCSNIKLFHKDTPYHSMYRVKSSKEKANTIVNIYLSLQNCIMSRGTRTQDRRSRKGQRSLAMAASGVTRVRGKHNFFSTNIMLNKSCICICRKIA